MATYSQELENALLPVPWLAKRDSHDKSFLIKYAPHPSKPGYVALVTDLVKTYFEPLAGIRILARQREVEEKYGQSQKQQDGGGSSLDVGGEQAVQEVLEGVAGLLGEELQDAGLDVSPGDLYDLDVALKTDDTSWLFHMTEIRYGCLEILTRHLIHPLALSISASRRPANTTDDQITGLVTSSKVLEAINRHSAHKQPKSRNKPSPEPSPRVSKPVETEPSAGGKARLVRRRPETTKTASPSPASPVEQGFKSPSPTLRNDNTPPNREGKVKSPVKDQNAIEDEGEEMMPEEPSSPQSKESARATKGRARRESTPPPHRSARQKKPDTPSKKSDARPADEQIPQSHTPSPPPPSAPSQKTQQEKDEEEEEALAKKREEMKRRMGAGGGGRLVRRRFG